MDSRPPENHATAKLRAEFKEWKEREMERTLTCKWANPEGIKAMFAHITQQEVIFNRSLITAPVAHA